MNSWTYKQTTGEMENPEGDVIEVGYAGFPPFVNRPRAEPLEDRGPLPSGLYTIEAAVDHPNLGPCSLPLTPDAENEMYGRSGFYVHGDSASMDETASKGCIILSRAARDQIAASDIRMLTVVV